MCPWFHFNNLYALIIFNSRLNTTSWYYYPWWHGHGQEDTSSLSHSLPYVSVQGNSLTESREVLSISKHFSLYWYLFFCIWLVPLKHTGPNIEKSWKRWMWEVWTATHSEHKQLMNKGKLGQRRPQTVTFIVLSSKARTSCISHRLENKHTISLA
jgi:hypothetical protein